MGVVVVPLHMKSIPTRNYIYLVYDPDCRDALIVDPVGDVEMIERELRERQLILRGILVTHTHADHIGLVRPLSDAHGCPIWVSSEEAARVKAPSDRIRAINDEAPRAVGELTVKPLLTPGHTLGSICYLIEDNLFTGDTLFTEGCGMCSGPNANPGLLFDSLQKLKRSLSPETRIFPGHRYVHPIGLALGYVMTHNIYLQFEAAQRDMFISFRMRPGQKNLFAFH